MRLPAIVYKPYPIKRTIITMNITNAACVWFAYGSATFIPSLDRKSVV